MEKKFTETTLQIITVLAMEGTLKQLKSGAITQVEALTEIAEIIEKVQGN
jgi:hypothetical protein